MHSVAEIIFMPEICTKGIRFFFPQERLVDYILVKCLVIVWHLLVKSHIYLIYSLKKMVFPSIYYFLLLKHNEP